MSPTRDDFYDRKCSEAAEGRALADKMVAASIYAGLHRCMMPDISGYWWRRDWVCCPARKGRPETKRPDGKWEIVKVQVKRTRAYIVDDEHGEFPIMQAAYRYNEFVGPLPTP